ncbi:MAG: transposase [Kiritimatiellales bacterium]
MPRKPRIEFAGAIYHVMSRGNRQDAIFLDDRDCETFLDTLAEACGRTGWRIHAFVLMGNHYHLLLETPQANLVAGMKWLQGTYTQRFNSRHNQWGHLLQGRYKALLVDHSGGEYFQTVGSYIHLNPARAGLFDLSAGNLSDYRWSSYSLYLHPSKRPSWLSVDRIFGAAGLADDKTGRDSFRRIMQKRVVEIANSATPKDADERWADIRRGWCFGNADFCENMIGKLDRIIGVSGKRESFNGTETKQHDEIDATKLFEAGLSALRISESDLKKMKKNCAEKCCLAQIIRKNTCVSNDWIKRNLRMGKATNFAVLVKRADEEQAQPIMQKLKNIKISD